MSKKINELNEKLERKENELAEKEEELKRLKEDITEISQKLSELEKLFEDSFIVKIYRDLVKEGLIQETPETGENTA